MVEEVAKSCDFVAAVEGEVQEYSAALNPSLGYSREISALVCTPVESDSSVLLERVCFGRDFVAR